MRYTVLSLLFVLLAFSTKGFAQLEFVSTIAGDGQEGLENGAASKARFLEPYCIVEDAHGNMFVSDVAAPKIRKISPDGIVSDFVGSNEEGMVDGMGSAARFYQIFGLDIDSKGNLYAADVLNHRIRMITPDGVVSTVAGASQNTGVQNGGFVNGSTTVAEFNNPFDIAVAENGDIYVADAANHRIRKITPSGQVSTFAGSGMKGFADGSANVAMFDTPMRIALDKQGNLYVGDLRARLRKVSSTGAVSTLAGSSAGNKDGTGSSAQFNHITGIAVASNDVVYVTDRENNRICHVSPEGEVKTILGGEIGFVDGDLKTARIARAHQITLNAEGELLFSDKENHAFRKLGKDTSTVSRPSVNIPTLQAQIYPNPTSGFVKVVLAEGVSTQTPAELLITDGNGRLVHTQKVTSPETTLSLDGMAKGMYIIQLFHKGQAASETLIVQ